MICLSSAGIPTRFETTYLLHNLQFLKQKILYFKKYRKWKKNIVFWIKKIQTNKLTKFKFEFIVQKKFEFFFILKMHRQL